MTTPNDAVREKIDTSWADFLATIDGLDDDALTTAGVVGQWSVKDLLGHITTWEDLTMTLSQHQLAGATPDGWAEANEPWDLDAYNARESEAKADTSLELIFQQLNETHGRLMTWLAEVPAEALVTGHDVEDRLRADTWEHYPEHAASIRAWRDSRE